MYCEYRVDQRIWTIFKSLWRHIWWHRKPFHVSLGVELIFWVLPYLNVVCIISERKKTNKTGSNNFNRHVQLLYRIYSKFTTQIVNIRTWRQIQLDYVHPTPWLLLRQLVWQSFCRVLTYWTQQCNSTLQLINVSALLTIFFWRMRLIGGKFFCFDNSARGNTS